MNTVPARASRTQEYDLEEDDAYYIPRSHTSAIRLTHPRQQVIQRGNKRIIIHDEPLPKQRGNHWLLYVGIGMVCMLLIWFGVQTFDNWWIQHQLDSVYGMPRTYQTDQVVGHSDSTDHPTHFVAVNLNSKVTIIEIPGGDNKQARIYSGPTLFSDNGGSIPVTLEFKDVNGDRKVDMIIHVGDQSIVYLNDGTQFKPQQ